MLLKTIRNITIGLVAVVGVMAGIALAQDKPADKPQRTFDTQEEYDLVMSIEKEATPQGRLSKLEEWKRKFPSTKFNDVRMKGFLVAYSQLNRPREAFNQAQEMLKADPNDEFALRTMLAMAQAMPNPTPDELQTTIRTAQQIVNNADSVYAADKKPADQNDQQWADLKKLMRPYAQRTIGWAYMTLKDVPNAEKEIIKTLEMDPTQCIAAFWLAGLEFGLRTQDPAKQIPAIFYYARAAQCEGPNALDANARAQIKKTFSSYYKQYHGSSDGENDVLAAAKNNAVMPNGFTIVDIGTIKQQAAIKDAEERAKNPAMTFWMDTKKTLTGDGGEAYFNEHIKETALPFTFKGKLISMKPAIRPKEIVLAVEKPDVADLTIKLDEGQVLPGKMEPGADIEVTEGVGTAYTKEPYMLTLTVDKAKIVGWVPVKTAPVTPGKNKSVSKGGKKGL